MNSSTDAGRQGLNIAVVGSGVAGLSAAWLLSSRHHVTVFEAAPRLGGHSNTVDVPGPEGAIPVDTGFIVYNEKTYPNLTALFAHCGVATEASDMSFSVSLDGGRFEYGTANLKELLGQRRNLVRPRFWRMLMGLLAFYREATADLHNKDLTGLSLTDYLQNRGGDPTYIRDHLLPMAAAVWSQPLAEAGSQDVTDFLRFCDNHGLMAVSNRPQWRTVSGGSREYIKKLCRQISGPIHTNRAIRAIERAADGVILHERPSVSHRFDHVVLASHANQSLQLLKDCDPEERRLLAPFHYRRNVAVLHGDADLMPQRKRVWSSWNYTRRDSGHAGAKEDVAVTYWMNRLQNIDQRVPLFVSLNPTVKPADAKIHGQFIYHHPCFDLACRNAQRHLWSLQGRRRTWFCGSYFGAGFHEDAVQSGLAVAEQLGQVQRPWHLSAPSNRIFVTENRLEPVPLQAAE